MERIHPAPAQTVLQGKARIFPKISVEEISLAIRQFAPDYCGDCVNNESQAFFDSIRRFAGIAAVRVGPGLAHGAFHQTRPTDGTAASLRRWYSNPEEMARSLVQLSRLCIRRIQGLGSGPLD